MRPNQIDEQRLNVLEDILEIQYEKLGDFQRELPINASTNQKFELKQRIKREILPDIRKYEVEYGQILAAGIQEAFQKVIIIDTFVVPRNSSVTSVFAKVRKCDNACK
ncbi:MAG TPA: hypothetical protein V6D33_12265 [Cyanophyceae cyanobacterium]